MKKLTSMFLALVMALALAVPAFADETLKIDGSIQMPTINVVMPTTASLVLNPYEMNVKLGTENSSDQIISSKMQIKNLSNIAIQVGAKALGTTGKGEVTFSNASVASDTTAKKAYIYGVFEIGKATDSVESTGTKAVTIDTNETNVTGFGFDDAAANTNTLAPVLLDDTKNPAPGGVLNFQFFGDMSKRTDWLDKDTLGITMTFKFTPNSAYTPSAGDATVGLDNNALGASGNLVATYTAGTSGLNAVSWSWESDDEAVATVASANNDGNAAVTLVSTTSSDSCNITVTVTLNNGATVTDTCVVTVP